MTNYLASSLYDAFLAVGVTLRLEKTTAGMVTQAVCDDGAINLMGPSDWGRWSEELCLGTADETCEHPGSGHPEPLVAGDVVWIPRLKGWMKVTAE